MLSALKTAKGTTDFGPRDMAIREEMFAKIIRVFKLHGAVAIDTPVFELKEVLTNKYGEDSKLIYDLVDQGGEICSLRYDLTVPLARYLAMNKVKELKRYHIAKVYRRDQPTIKKGRRREFFQCDFDIAGTSESMISDAEAINVMVAVLDEVCGNNEYVVKINHRGLLDGLLLVCGVPKELLRPACSAIDKLDKVSPQEIKTELVEKNVTEESADKILDYICSSYRGSSHARLTELLSSELAGQEEAKKAIEELILLYKYLNAYSIANKVEFDISLARGLDYYTGVIYEAKFRNEVPENGISIGSIAGGGRFDNLVGIFSGASKSGKPNHPVPCVGVSIGVERLFAVISEQANVKHVPTQVYVTAMSRGILSEVIKIATELRQRGISTEFTYKNNPKMQRQFEICDRDLIPLAVVVGEDELASGIVLIKDMRMKVAGEFSRGEPVSRENMADLIIQKLNLINGS